jgi:hypothetical protein
LRDCGLPSDYLYIAKACPFLGERLIHNFDQSRKPTVFRRLPIFTFLLLSFLGCDNAAKQQQANQAQRAAIANDLREQGEAMHDDENAKPATSDAENQTP